MEHERGILNGDKPTDSEFVKLARWCFLSLDQVKAVYEGKDFGPCFQHVSKMADNLCIPGPNLEREERCLQI